MSSGFTNWTAFGSSCADTPAGTLSTAGRTTNAIATRRIIGAPPWTGDRIVRMEQRLQKILSQAGVASRRAAERLIADGRVTLNGKTVVEMGIKADADKDDIRVDGRRLHAPERKRYLLLNKPAGVV